MNVTYQLRLFIKILINIHLTNKIWQNRESAVTDAFDKIAQINISTLWLHA